MLIKQDEREIPVNGQFLFNKLSFHKYYIIAIFNRIIHQIHLMEEIALTLIIKCLLVNFFPLKLFTLEPALKVDMSLTRWEGNHFE